MRQEIEDYVRSLGLDAYLVGGAVRDELLGLESKDADFLVPGVDTEGLRAALASHGRVEDLVVADRLVGVRFHPRNGRIRQLTRAGIEFAPPRKEVSTGPGRHDFEIVADPSLSIEDDMRRRDFTVNAMARRLETGELVDPLDGRADLEARRLRTVSPQSFREDPLRLVRALRFVSQLGFEPDEELLAQMREEAPAVKLVSGERIGGGLAADGMGELSRLLLGAEPARALRLARDTGVLVELLPEFGPAVGFDQESRYHDLTVDEHTFAVVQAAADKGFALQVRLAALFHDLGKPVVGWRGRDGRLHYYAKPGSAAHGHDQVGADLAAGALLRLRYPNALRKRVVRIVRRHMFQPGKGDARRARRFLYRNGDELAFDLLDHKHADLLGKRGTEGEPPPVGEIDALLRFRKVVEEELSSPHRLRDLAIDGNDLIELGFRSSPQLGRILHDLLEAVVEEPGLNTREQLLARAKERL
ncbi:MAG TPA: CCA tRNA nucleotidyltransferase [Gaiellaceae bacterium]|nr:CCA tRNA nucleotidyltransferase [Gaiellaceae bacterium]